MTDQMDTEQFDRQLRDFLAWQADDVHGAPTATDIAARISSRTGSRADGLRLTPQLVWILILGALILALMAAALIGASLLRHDPLPPSRAANGWVVVSANPKDVGGGEAGDIYLIGEGAAARRIVGSSVDGVAQACPRFSPDGQMLAYGEASASEPVTTFRGEWPVPDRAVVVVGVNDRGDVSVAMIRVALPEEPGEIACPEWSPDSAQVAFRVGPELWIVDAVSGVSTVVPVTEAPFGQQGLEWSRDGSRIAVAEPGQIRVIRIAGGASSLIPVDGATPGSLGWTASDEMIVYISTDEPGDGLAVNVVGADGRNDTQLTADAADVQLRFHYAVVSPGGTRVAYLQRTFRCTGDGCTQDPERVLVMGTKGLGLVEVPIPSGFGVSGLQWSPDGERLLFGSVPGVVSVGLTPGASDIVYSREELNLEWSPSEFSWQAVYE